MPTKLKRYSVSLPEDIQIFIEKEASLKRRPVANQIMWILDQWCEERKRELDHFRPSPLPGERKAPPVFETPSPLPSEQVSKLRESLGRERS